jgi:hypothetical protein
VGVIQRRQARGRVSASVDQHPIHGVHGAGHVHFAWDAGQYVACWGQAPVKHTVAVRRG